MLRKITLAALAAFSGLLALRAEIDPPWKDVFIGSFDGRGWCGLVLAPQKDAAFAFRFKIEKDGVVADGDDLFFMVSEVGPRAPDGLYSRIKFDLGLPILPADKKPETPILIKPSAKADTVTFEWSRQDERTVIGRLQAPKNVKVHFVPYFPWDFKGRYKALPDGEIQGESRTGKRRPRSFWTHRPGAAAAAEGEEGPTSSSPRTTTGASISWRGRRGRRSVRKHITRYKNAQGRSTPCSTEESDRYQKKRVPIDGPLSKASRKRSPTTCSLEILYQPGAHRLYTPAGRRWIFPRPDGTPDHWQIFGWDSFFNALELALGELRRGRRRRPGRPRDPVPERQHPELAEPLRRDTGPVPAPRRGLRRPQALPAGRAIRDFLSRRLSRSSENGTPSGRPGSRTARSAATGTATASSNGDRTASSSPDKVPAWEVNAAPGEQRAKWESGQDDLPNWDDVPYNAETGTLTMNCLDLNCLYALDAWCLSQIADILSKPDERRGLSRRIRDG